MDQMDAVITRLMGGLGNQMFQYAAGHALATRLGVPLLLDRSFLDQRGPQVTWTQRAFELNAFQLDPVFAKADLVDRILRRSNSRLLRLLPSPGLSQWRHFREKDKTFDPAFEKVSSPVLIDGFWQSERYFQHIGDALRTELFVPRSAPSEQNAMHAARISTGTSASLHVRLGDYVSNPEAARYHGVCSWDYYREAATWLVEQRGVDHFHIFTDTPEIVRNTLQLPFPHTVIAHNTGAAAAWDLWLMRQARHHIVANSSFSWWGAWLDPRPDKVVIAPRIWLAGDPRPNDIIPPTWIVR